MVMCGMIYMRRKISLCLCQILSNQCIRSDFKLRLFYLLICIFFIGSPLDLFTREEDVALLGYTLETYMDMTEEEVDFWCYLQLVKRVFWMKMVINYTFICFKCKC